MRSALEAGLLIDALRGLREEGFEILSISGGEPFVYRGLSRLVNEAAELGYRVHVVTNGLLLTRERLAALAEHLHFVAVSFDGAEETHNQVRGRPDAFRRANAALELLAEAGTPFGLAFGVSRWSLSDVPWAFERARTVGADLLHLRPLVPEGRANELPGDWTLSGEDCARLVVIRDLLDAGPARTPRVQVDLVAVAALLGVRHQFELLCSEPNGLSLSDVVNPIVIDERGRCLAFTYGIDPRFVIADLAHDWRREITRFKAEAADSITELLEASFKNAFAQQADYVDWFALLTAVSHTIGESTRDPARSTNAVSFRRAEAHALAPEGPDTRSAASNII